jgi:hypothetical protein
MLTLALFAGIAIGSSYLTKRRPGIGWGLAAYLVGIALTFGALIAGLLILDAQGVPALEANKLFGPASWSAIIGPAIGIWLAKRRGAQQAALRP